MGFGMWTNRVYVFCPKHQADAVISQANPVSATLYEVLATTKNVRIIGFSVVTTDGTTSLLEVVVTIDGRTLIFLKNNPTSAIVYFPALYSDAAENAGLLAASADNSAAKAFLLEGRSVKIEARITWTVQPSPLGCRVKWAKW